MNTKIFFKKALMTVAFVLLTITVAMATEVDITVNVTGNGTVSYENKSASDGQSFTFKAELSSVAPYNLNYVTFTVSPNAAGYVLSSVMTHFYCDGEECNSNYWNNFNSASKNMIPFEPATDIEINFLFEKKGLLGGTENDPVVLSDNQVSELSGGWYRVNENITFDHTLTLYGDTYLEIEQNVTMTVNSTENGIIVDKFKEASLTIVGNGTLNVVTAEGIGISVKKYEQRTGTVVVNSITSHGTVGLLFSEDVICGGSLIVSGFNTGIESHYDFVISGGSVTATGGERDIIAVNVIITDGQVNSDGNGILANMDLTLGLTSSTSYIKATAYSSSLSYGIISIADGQILQDEQGNLYAGTLTSEQIAAITNTKLTLKGQNALTITQDQNGTSVNLQGDFSTSDENQLVISSEMQVDNLTIKRSFIQDIPSSVMFPFSFDADKNIGEFYTLHEVVLENGVWTAKMAGPIEKISANTPYIFKPKKDIDENNYLKFKNVKLQPTSTTNTNGSESDWTLHGVYTTTFFDNIQEVCYGFAGVDAPEQGISEGQFIRAGEGSWVNPMRCYLTYNKNNGVFAKSAPDLPDYIRVVFPDEVEESESGEIVTPVSSLSETTGVKVWSSNRTIFIDAQPDTDYTIVDLSGRVLKTGITHSTREEITLSASGIVIVKIGKQTFKIIL